MDFTAFSQTYQEAREKFLSATKDAKQIEHLQLKALNKDNGGYTEDNLKGINGEDLVIDIAVYGNVTNPKAILLHTSGVHGVEGFCGSAVQVQQLRENSQQFNDLEVCLIFVHAVNPYGMSWGRRWNESNVDLNRNFFFTEVNRNESEPSEYEKLGTSEHYTNLKDLVNPKLSDIGSMDRLTFFASAAVNALKHGFNTLKQALAEGQSTYPNGIFFRGNRLEQGPRLFMTWFDSLLAKPEMSQVQRVVHIDVHTGLGKFGQDTLLINEKEIPEDYQGVFDLERFSPMDSSKSVAYAIYGDILYGFRQLLQSRNVTYNGICQEFGTYNPISVLRSLRWENAAWTELGESLPADHAAKRAVIDAFYPASDKNWKTLISTRGNILFVQGLKYAKTN